MFAEFREFINRGNVIDLAVAVVIGTAFGAIVTSLVDDILMPIVGVLLGGVDFSGLTLGIGEATIQYGSFIQSVVNFFIIAFAIFMIVRAVNRVQRHFEEEQAEETAAPPEPTEEVKLLTEIRDLLLKQQSSGP